MVEPDRKFELEPNDLPLSSIPSVPRGRLGRPERRGPGAYLLGAVALFAAIVAVSFVLAPYLKMPEAAARGGVATPPVTDSPAELAPAAEQATPTELTSTASGHEVRAPAKTPSAPSPRPDQETRIAGLEADLAAKESALLGAQRNLGKERKARKTAESNLADARKTATARQSDSSSLERRVTELTTARDAADRRSAERIRDLESRLASADKAASRSAVALESTRQRAASATSAATQAGERHAADRQAESDAVRRLLAQLDQHRTDAESERAARLVAERRVRELESERSRAAPKPKARVTSASPDATESIELTSPERVKTVPPRYPDDLRRARVSGRVLLRLLVDEMGNVSEIEIQESPHPRLASVAKTAARQWKYVPARRDGIRISTWVSEAVDFQL